MALRGLVLAWVWLLGSAIVAGADARGACSDEQWPRVGGDGQVRCQASFVGPPPEQRLAGACEAGSCVDGHGTMRWPGGESYTGGFRQGLRAGEGRFEWPDGRLFVGQWAAGVPNGLGTRIWPDGRYRVGYYEQGRFVGSDVAAAARLAAVPAPDAAPPPAAAPGPSCAVRCEEESELQLERIVDEYECCNARHAFCAQKAEIAQRACDTGACREAQRAAIEACDTRYACEAVKRRKVAGHREQESSCVERCVAGGLEHQGLRVSERGTLIDE